jgi:hypothetical protein
MPNFSNSRVALGISAAISPTVFVVAIVIALSSRELSDLESGTAS